MMKFPYKIIDLTHTLDKNIPAWEGGCGFSHELKCDYADCDTDVQFRVQELKMVAGIGTHIDAPAHCIPGALTVDALKVDDLVAPCVCIDVSDKVSSTFSVSTNDILAFEKTYGKINKNTFVIIYTGWDQYWNDPEKYQNQYMFPSVSADVADLLLERDIVGLGIDTLSPDRPTDGFPVHEALLGSGKYIVENIACASKLPPVSIYTLAMPIKVAGGTEAPIRLLALIDKN
ncbi:MAG: kynurenine formamidase [Chlamydiales bacterium]|jgi:kynurenine formamidase